MAKTLEDLEKGTAPTGASSASPAIPKPIMLTPEDQQKILGGADRTGWNIEAYAVPETEWKQTLTGVVQVPTGKYTVSINDGRGNNQQVSLRQSGDWLSPSGERRDWIVDTAPKELPKPAETASTVKIIEGWDGTQYRIDTAKPNEAPTIVLPGNQMKTASGQLDLAAQNKKFAEMLANEQKGNGFTTDQQVIQNQRDLEKGILDRDTLKQRQLEQAQKNALDWQTESRLQGQSTAQIGLMGAQTGATAAEGQLTAARMADLLTKSPLEVEGLRLANQLNDAQYQEYLRQAPAKLAEAVARGELTQAQADTYKQQLRAPTIANVGESPYITTRTPEGRIDQSQINLAYQPKTLAEVAARTSQIQAMADAKHREVMGKVNGESYTADDALAEFNAWYDQNVTPHQASLQAAQEEAQYQRAKDAADSQRLNYQQAAAAGTQAINAYNAQAGRVSAPGFADAFNAAKSGSMKGVDPRSFLMDEPDLQQQATQATMEALKYISPGAAQATGSPMPNYQGMDIAAAFDRNRWSPQGQPVAPGAGGVPGPGPTPGQPAGFTPRPGESAEASIARNAMSPIPQPPPGIYNTGFLPRPGESALEAQRRIAAMNPDDYWGGYAFGG